MKTGAQVTVRSAKEDDAEGDLALVAEVNGSIVGQLDFTNGHRMRNAHTGKFGIAVHKDFREIGIGSLLLRALIDWGIQNPKIEKLNLAVHKTNERAIAVYAKMGFQVEGVRTKDLKYPDAVYIDSVLMGLQV